jgi:hypothetical protein
LQVAPQVASQLQEIQAAVILAKQFPRVYDDSWARLMKACQRKTLAEKARYRYPRGGKMIVGPSVNLARVAAQCYGNIRWGLNILRNDNDEVLIEGWAWDMEQNIKSTAQDCFKKLIFRKDKGWVTPDERDLRELINRRGAILVRNCLLNILPKDLIEDAEAQAEQALRKQIKDPSGERKRLILEFDKYGVTVDMLNRYIGQESWGADDIIHLKEILNSIQDGQAKREDYFPPTKAATPDENGQGATKPDESRQGTAKQGQNGNSLSLDMMAPNKKDDN